MSIVSPGRLRLLLLTLLTLALAATLGLGVAPPGAAAPAALRAGTGYRVPGGDFVGFYVTRSGVKVYCIDPGKREPRSVSLRTLGRYPGMPQHSAEQLAYALATWGDARTRTQAAAESQVVNTVVGHRADVRRRAAHLPRSVNALVAAHLRAVRALSGPYRLRVATQRTAAPGQVVTGTVSLISAAGRGLARSVVHLQGSANVTVPAAVRTGGGGTATFHLAVTGPGPVRIDATAAGLAPARLLGSRPAVGRQRMVTWAGRVGAAAHLGFQARLGSVSHSYSCTTACDGHPATTLRSCAVASSYPSRLLLRLGAAGQVLDFPASARPSCRTITVVLADRDHVSGTWSFRGPHGWTAAVAAAGSFVVDCPPVPAVEVSMSYDCTQGSLAAAVTAPGGHAAVLIVTGLPAAGGADVRRLAAAPGASARFATAVHCGDVQRYAIQAGVQRSTGQWNYGPAAQLTTPGPARQP